MRPKGARPDPVRQALAQPLHRNRRGRREPALHRPRLPARAHRQHRAGRTGGTRPDGSPAAPCVLHDGSRGGHATGTQRRHAGSGRRGLHRRPAPPRRAVRAALVRCGRRGPRHRPLGERRAGHRAAGPDGGLPGFPHLHLGRAGVSGVRHRQQRRGACARHLDVAPRQAGQYARRHRRSVVAPRHRQGLGAVSHRRTRRRRRPRGGVGVLR